MTERIRRRSELEPPAEALTTHADAAPRSYRHYLGALGPGVVSGAADVDPTTVATLAVIGAGTMYGLAWLTLLLFP